MRREWGTRALLGWALWTILVASPVIAAPARLAASFGFPEMLAIQLGRSIGESWELGLSAGILTVPGMNAFAGVGASDLSEDYAIDTDPKIESAATSVFIRYRLGAATYLRAYLAVFVLNAGVRASLRNKSSQQSTNVAHTDVSLFSSSVGIQISTRLWGTEPGVVEGGVGVGYFTRFAIHSATTGYAPAYMTVVPEASESITDGLPAFAQDLEETVGKFKLPSILPTFFVRYSW